MCESMLLNLLFAVVMIPTVAIYALLLAVHIMMRRSFDKSFSRLITAVILAYMMSAFGDIPTRALYPFISKDTEIYKAIESFDDFFYVCSTCLLISSLFERLLATVWEKATEGLAGIIVVYVSLAVSCTFSVLFVLLNKGVIPLGPDVASFGLLALYVLSIVLLVLLVFTNMKSTTRVAVQSIDIYERYHISENVKAVRILLPLAFCDTTVAFIEMMARSMFGVDEVIDDASCDKNLYFGAEFALFRTLSFLGSLAAPIVILFRHEGYRRRVRMLFHTVWQKDNDVHMHVDYGTKRAIVNVMGVHVKPKEENEPDIEVRE